MPIYEYQCVDCGGTTEVIQRLDAPAPAECPACKGAMRKRPAAPAFHFKGSGWYVTDYARNASSQKPEGKEEAAGDAKAAKAEPSTGPRGKESAVEKSSGSTKASVGVVLALLLLGPAWAWAQQLGPLALRAVAGVEARTATGAPLYVGEAADVGPLGTLEPAAIAARGQLEALAEWNRAGRLPLQTGFARPLPQPRIVVLSGSLLRGELPRPHQGGIVDLGPGGELVWAARIDVADAFGFRIVLAEVELPAATRFWVYAPGDLAPRSYGMDLVDPRGTLWLPWVEHESAWLEVAIPTEGIVAGKRFRFVLREVAEGFRLGPGGEPVTGRHVQVKEEEGCTVDGACVEDGTFPAAGLLRKAVARLQFSKGGGLFACTGTLLNNTAEDFTPFLLTANHCFSTQESASSLTARFDFHSSECDGPVQGSALTVQGATLLATGEATDFTFVRLNESPPAPRAFLGWNADPSVLHEGTELHRFSHPRGLKQTYSKALFKASGQSCLEVPRPRFLYSELQEGSTEGGSSGSAVVLADGLVVGQLLGACGPNPTDTCDFRNLEVDGAFHQTYPEIAQWLAPAVEACSPTSKNLCLNNGRFKVEVFWRDDQGNTGQGEVVPAGTQDSGLFWFFDPDNWEMLVKVLNACDLPAFHTYWVFAAATTDVEYTLRVTDSQSGQVWQQTNPLGQASPAITDTDAFATCP